MRRFLPRPERRECGRPVFLPLPELRLRDAFEEEPVREERLLLLGRGAVSSSEKKEIVVGLRDFVRLSGLSGAVCHIFQFLFSML